MKTLCSVHRFYYTGNSCPFCHQDKMSKLGKKYDKIAKEDENQASKKEDREITQSDIDKLKAKFGC